MEKNLTLIEGLAVGIAGLVMSLLGRAVGSLKLILPALGVIVGAIGMFGLQNRRDKQGDFIE